MCCQLDFYEGVLVIRRFIFILVPFLIIYTIYPAKADTLNNKLNNYQNQLNTINNTLAAQKQQESAAVQQALSLQSSINVLQNAIQENDAAISQHQQTISSLKTQQQTLATKLQEDISLLSSYLRTQYESEDDNGYIEWLFSSKSLGDVLSKLEYIQSIVNAYKGLENQVAADVATIQAKQKAEQSATDQLANAVQSQQQMENSLNVALTKQKDTVNSLTEAESQTVKAQTTVQNDITETEQLIKQQELEAELAAQNQQQQAAQQASDKSMTNITTPVRINATTAQLLAFAENFLGIPYVWGGTTPNPGFDCSGYVQYVYAHFGVNLYRVTWDQYAEGQSVPESDLKPGDLVFFSTYAPGASHVGIYVGNHMMIDSSDHGVAYDSIVYPYWANRYLGARRIIAQ